MTNQHDPRTCHYRFRRFPIDLREAVRVAWSGYRQATSHYLTMEEFTIMAIQAGLDHLETKNTPPPIELAPPVVHMPIDTRDWRQHGPPPPVGWPPQQGKDPHP